MKVTNHSPSLLIKLAGTMFSLAIFAFVGSGSVGAQEAIPTFANCPTPGGPVVAAYPEGWHWIVGYDNLQWGADTVFAVGDNNFVQCFCPLARDGQPGEIQTGMQSNWIYSANISTDQRQSLIEQGWYVVANGADFGLPSGEYLVRNLPFDCSSCVNGDCSCVINVNQSNSAVVNNNVVTSINTGGNDASNNTDGVTTVVTGAGLATTSVSNQLNSNRATISGCDSCRDIDVRIEGNGAGSDNRVTLGGGTFPTLLESRLSLLRR